MTLTPDEARPVPTATADDTHPALWTSKGPLLSTPWPWLLFAAVLAFMPVIFGSGSALTVMNQMGITIVFALSYNMLLGQGGMLSFGHAAYMGLGGFFCMHIMRAVEYQEWPIPLPLLPIFGGLFGAFFALLVGSFQTRRAGTVFAMISLGVGELIAACSIIIVAFFGGEEGISGDRTYGPPVFGYDFASQGEVYYLTAVWVVISAIAMYMFSRTPMGRLANAVRDNEERAEFLGYSQQRVRWVSFTVSGFFAGVAGGLFAINFEILTEENLNLVTSGTILLVTFLGGAGFFFGPVVGAVVFTLLQTVLSLYTDLWQLYVGALFVLVVMFVPQGITGLFAMHGGPMRNRRLGALAIPYAKVLPLVVLFVLGLVAICEMVFHLREGRGSMNLYGLDVDPHEWLPLTLAFLVTVGAAWAIRSLMPSVREAWDVATLEGAEGPR